MVERFSRLCEELKRIDAAPLIEWVGGIDLSDWPQQHKNPELRVKPAMACDPEWFGFKARTDPVVEGIMPHFPGCTADTRMLSIVMAGDNIPPHVDLQSDNWRCRIHVPLISDDRSLFIVGGEHHHLEPGRVYMVNTLVEHSVVNDSNINRIHFMFDVRLENA